MLISENVKGVIWAAAVEPVIQILGLGSVFAAWNIAKTHNYSDNFIYKSESKLTEESKPTEESEQT